MTRQRRVSRILQKAQLRSYGLRAIDSNLDFGNNRTLQNLTQQMEQLRLKIQTYNSTIIMLDVHRNEIQRLEKNLGEFLEEMLLGVAVRYGKDSIEYELAGGVRKSKRGRKSKANRLKAAAKGKSTNKDQINKEQINQDQINQDQIDKEQINKDQINQDQINQDQIDQDQIEIKAPSLSEINTPQS